MKTHPIASAVTSLSSAGLDVRPLVAELVRSLERLHEMDLAEARRLAARTPEQVEADNRRIAEARARRAAEEAEERARDAREAAARAAIENAKATAERIASGAELPPEWASLEGFAEYRLGEEEETFTGADVRRLAQGTGMAPAAVREGLEALGLTFARRGV